MPFILKVLEGMEKNVYVICKYHGILYKELGFFRFGIHESPVANHLWMLKEGYTKEQYEK